MKLLIYSLVLLPFFSMAQELGIKFEQGLTWNEIKEKAKRENKSIFIDAYATWCVPCKAMDKNVYASEKVGEYVNKKFISVKVQMDSTKIDNEEIKKWYADAKKIFKEYQIAVFPTYLFFSSDGKIVHRGSGSQSVLDFISLAKNATNPNTQYYTLLEMYQRGELDLALLPDLALNTRRTGDRKLAYTIAQDYKLNFLDKLPDEKLFTNENISFLMQFQNLVIAEGSKGRIFKFIYNHRDSANKLFGRSTFADVYIDKIITNEEITNIIWKSDNTPISNPNWSKITRNIAKKYLRIDADKIVYKAQLDYYQRLNNWKSVARIVNQRLQKNPPKRGGGLDGDLWNLNVLAWDAFINSNEQSVLLSALKWSDLSISISDALDGEIFLYYDTKASLLYKLGRTEEAISFEQKAIENVKKQAALKGIISDPYTKGYEETIEQMRKGEPIYLAQGAKWPKK